MALRRVLPSRRTDQTGSEPSAAPKAAAQPQAEGITAPSAANISTPKAEAAAPAPAQTEAPSSAVSSPSFAAVASSAFSTLASQAGATSASVSSSVTRVLEDSFTPAPAPAAPAGWDIAEPAPATAPVVPVAAAPQLPALVGAEIAVEAPSQPVQKEAIPAAEEKTPVAAPAPSNQPAEPEVPAVSLPVPELPVVAQPQAPADVQPARAESSPVDDVAPVAAAVAEQKPRPAAQPQVERSRPSDNGFKRKVGESSPRGRQPQGQPSRRESREIEVPQIAEKPLQPKPQQSPAPVQAAASPVQPKAARVRNPRDFSSATVEAPRNHAASPAAGTAVLAEVVPVNTLSLDKVDEELIASGILAGPQKDALTSSVPMGIAESEMQWNEPATPAEPYVAPVNVPPQQSAQPQAAEAPSASSSSSLPWANTSTTGSSWDVDLPSLPTPTQNTSSPAAQPVPDYFKPAEESLPAAMPSPPWAQGNLGRSGPSLPPPEINQGRGRGRVPTSNAFTGIALAGAAAAVVAFMIWKGNSSQDQLQEKVARWTGSIAEQAENLPGTANGTLAPESTFSMAELGNASGTILAAQSGQGLLPPPPEMPGATPVSSSAQIDFADVTPDVASKPIVADGSEKMPEDVSLFAKFQQAVADARTQQKAQQNGVSSTQVAALPEPEGKLTPEQLKQELDAYRKSLASADNPKQEVANPVAFNKDPQAYMDGKTTSGSPVGNMPEGTLLPPPDLYTQNPKNLPIVGEPTTDQQAHIRTLADFQVQPSEPERAKVLVPRGLKPRLAASDFPAVEVLSFVPNRGIIAYASGREGVLLIGETLEGWQLTNVTPEVAEFRAGSKRHYVSTADN